jgi:hypothetical protein
MIQIFLPCDSIAQYKEFEIVLLKENTIKLLSS